MVTGWVEQITGWDDAVVKSRAHVLNFKRELLIVFVKDQVEEINVVIYVWNGTDASPVNSISLYDPFLRILGCSARVATICLLSQYLYTEKVTYSTCLKHLPAIWEWGLRTKSLVSLLKVY